MVRGKLVYEGIGLPKADCVANACRVKGADGSSSGDWMVVTELSIMNRANLRKHRNVHLSKLKNQPEQSSTE